MKTASQVYAPIAGTIDAVNENLAETPEDLTEDSAEGDSWLFKIKVSDDIDTSEMMDEEAYQKFCEEEEDHWRTQNVQTLIWKRDLSREGE